MEFLILCIGLCFGSFINVVAYSLPRKLDFIFRRSYCECCHHQLSYLDMIPVLSYIILKGKCRYCHHKINLRDTIVEIVCGCVGIIFYKIFTFNDFIIMYIFFLLLILMSLIDIDTMYVYDEMIILLFFISVILMHTYNLELCNRVLGMVGLSLPMFLFNKFYKEAFGGGDIKLFCVLGFLFGLEGILCIFIYSSFITCIYSFIYILKKYLSIQSYIPFIPFITGGVFCYIILGNVFIV